MKKMIALFIAVTFVATVAGMAFGRTLEEERDAVRAYLKVVDAKIIKYRKAGNTAKMKVLQAEKAGTLRRWEKLKAQMTAPVAPPPVAPAPPPPPPVVVKPAPAGPAPLLGLGWNTVMTGTYLNTGKGKISGGLGARADYLVDDMLGIGSLIGLSNDSVKYRVGLGAFYGADNYNRRIQALPLYVDGVLNMPAEWMGGIESYVGGGLNYVLYGSGKTTGTYGVQAYIGMKSDLGLGLGKTNFELGYGIIRANGSTPKTVAKGLTLSIGQDLVL